MKIKSLVLGSVAAAGLSTGAFAADLGVLTSLDVCDELGISGLTISSDTDCLAITGSVSYEFAWGDYEDGVFNNGAFPFAPGGRQIANTAAGVRTVITPDDFLDWSSKVEAWLQFTATANSDFGPAKAVIKIKDVQQVDGWGGHPTFGDGNVVAGGDDTGGPIFDEAYVAIGDTTMIIAGKASSIWNDDDDEPLTWIGLFNSDAVDKGVGDSVGLSTGGHVLQVTTDLGGGVSLSGGLENLNGTVTSLAGTAVGVIAYAGDGISAHASFAAGGFLDGAIDAWAVHSGVSGSFDMFKFVGAVAFDSTGYWNALGSAAATFDMFTLAVAGEAISNGDFGLSGSASADVTDAITINVGSKYYFEAGPGVQSIHAAAQVVADVTESIQLVGEVGYYAEDATPYSTFYGSGEVKWAPGGGFTGSVKGEAYSNGAYRATVKAAKTFE